MSEQKKRESLVYVNKIMATSEQTWHTKQISEFSGGRKELCIREFI